jgi:hypothetical protein
MIRKAKAVWPAQVALEAMRLTPAYQTTGDDAASAPSHAGDNDYFDEPHSGTGRSLEC